MDPRNQPSLLERIYSWENLLDAYHEAASEKWYRNDVTAFAANLEENLISIQNNFPCFPVLGRDAYYSFLMRSNGR